MHMNFEVVNEIQDSTQQYALLIVRYNINGLLQLPEEDMIMAGGIPKRATLRRIRDRLNIMLQRFECPDDIITCGTQLPTSSPDIFRVCGDEPAVPPSQPPEGPRLVPNDPPIVTGPPRPSYEETPDGPIGPDNGGNSEDHRSDKDDGGEETTGIGV